MQANHVIIDEIFPNYILKNKLKQNQNLYFSKMRLSRAKKDNLKSIKVLKIYANDGLDICAKVITTGFIEVQKDVIC